MKQIGKLGALGLMIIALCSTSINVTAQQRSHGGDTTKHHGDYGNKQHHWGIAGLTADQQKKIDALELSSRKETLPVKNQLNEKRAHLTTLQSADKADMKAINSTIDEISQLQSQLKKKEAAKHESIRQLLTDDQRVAFDSRKSDGKRMHRGGHHGGRGDHSRN